ncbi:MAG: cell division protein FtsL [Candidatus Rokubacteria bacterium]|nr:cell division protein FtsL [Candidatus Rokubacteria bacterium]
MRIDERGGAEVRRHWTGRLDPASQQAARFHRERDRRRLRAMGVGVLCASVLMAMVLGIVGLRVHHVRLSYRLEALRGRHAAADELNRRLRVELATLGSLARIEERARMELGMVPPGRDQVRLAREFIPAGSGMPPATPPRTASAQPASLAGAPAP